MVNIHPLLMETVRVRVRVRVRYPSSCDGEQLFKRQTNKKKEKKMKKKKHLVVNSHVNPIELKGIDNCRSILLTATKSPNDIDPAATLFKIRVRVRFRVRVKS
jgi:hypothetical protein